MITPLNGHATISGFMVDDLAGPAFYGPGLIVVFVCKGWLVFTGDSVPITDKTEIHKPIKLVEVHRQDLVDLFDRLCVSHSSCQSHDPNTIRRCLGTFLVNECPELNPFFL